MWLVFAMAVILVGCTLFSKVQDTNSGQAAVPMKQLNETELDKSLFYRNPVIRSGADPGVFRASNGTYYAYPTGGSGFKAHSSSDLAQWKDEGQALRAIDISWGDKNFWAPQVVEAGGKYYMYFSASKGEDRPRIGVAVADSPKGPFKDVLKQPLLTFEFSTIDPYVFVDDDGKIYMYYAKNQYQDGSKHISETHVIELNDDMISTKGEPKLVTKPEQAWEKQSGNREWNEGAFVLKHKGVYYLMFSANCYCSRKYAVGYATSDSPTGPFVKYGGNPILSAEHAKVSGPGHHSIIPSPDGKELWMMYHTHIDAQKGEGARQLNIDRIGFRSDGSIYVNGPSITNQLRPSGTTGRWRNIASEASVTVSSVKQGYSKTAVVDGEIGISRRFDKYDWVPANESEGAWVQLAWSSKRTVRSVMIYDSANYLRFLQSGKLILDGGNELEVVFPTEPGAAAVIELAGRQVKSLKFVIGKAATNEAGLSEIVVVGE
jgi:GH43 family beta-xylosidase